MWRAPCGSCTVTVQNCYSCSSCNLDARAFNALHHTASGQPPSLQSNVGVYCFPAKQRGRLLPCLPARFALSSAGETFTALSSAGETFTALSSAGERLPHVLLQLQDDGQRVLALRTHALHKLHGIVLKLSVLRGAVKPGGGGSSGRCNAVQ